MFFDLVYVLAVTQLTRHLLANLTLRGVLETLILLLAVWGRGTTSRGSRTTSISATVRRGWCYELAIAHPGDQVHAATACLVLGGPALFLVGHALFKRALWGYVPMSRLGAIGTLVALIPVAVVSTVLVLLALTTTVVVAAASVSSRAGAPAR